MDHGLFEEFAVFEIDGKRCALSTRCVREVLRATSFVTLPNAPAAIEGIINVRGEIAAVVSLRKRFALPERPMALSDHLLVANDGHRLFALLTDRVCEVVRIARDDVVSASQFSHPEDISGVVQQKDGLVLIYDLSKFLTSAEALALDSAMAERSAP